MSKVRFEFNIDEIVETYRPISIENEIFNKEDSTGKTFLFVDKLEGFMQVAICIKAASGDNRAIVDFFPLPNNSKIINDEEDKHEAMMAHVQNCCDIIRKGLVDFQNEVSVYIGQEFDALKAEGISNGNGISENTLLSALEIVTKNKQHET